MLSLRNSIRIEKALSEVFAFVSDPCNTPKWNYFVLEVKKTNGVNGVGAAYLQTRKTDQQAFRITEWKENQICVSETFPGERPAARRTLLFEGDYNQTVLIDRIDLKLPIPNFLSNIFARRPRKAVKKNLEKLKILLETGSVVLQDGREILYH